MKTFIVYSFLGMKDPLFGGLMLPYLKELNKDGKYQFHLITYEQDDYAFHQLEKAQLIAELNRYNLKWHPIQYHTGRFLLLKKGYDFFVSFLVALKIKIKYRPAAIIGFLTIAGAFSWILSKILRLPLAIYCFEPHSDYMIDFNIWTKNSIKYKLLNFFEKKEATDCDYLVVPTSHTLDLVQQWHTRAKKIWTAPISVDTTFFQFEAQKREQIRQHLKIEDKKVILYLGKFGGLYYELPEMAAFCKQLVNENPDYFLLIISPQPKMEVELAYRQAGVEAAQFCVLGRVPYEEVSGYISAADIGLVAIPPLPAQKYRTPIKVGHYLACGLPYIIAENIADDDKIAKQHQVGIVYQDLSEEAAKQIRAEMQALLSEEPKEIRARCRQVALQYRSITQAREILEEILALF